jgi:Ca2+-binding EF-hand superfamily protein
MADKFSLIFDFSTPVDFQSFMSQVETFLKSKELMTQLAFDLYDYNNDGRISENDLFRIFRYFEVSSFDDLGITRLQNNPQIVFEKAFQRDLCTMVKFMQSRRQAKAQLEA